MSQELVPIADSEGLIGTSATVVTTPLVPRVTALSDEYRIINDLVETPTQWRPGGRPIYRRLPAASEAYVVDFFSDGDLGYTLIPYGQDQFGAGSMYVSVSEDRQALLVYDGVIVWKEGTTPVLKSIIDFREIGAESGRYLVAYQLIYDDAPIPLPYQVTDFSLGGLDFAVNDSASSVFLTAEAPNGNAWPYPGINAFAPASANLSWKNYLDTVNQIPQQPAGVLPGIPEEYQPKICWLEWQSVLPWKLDTITLRTPLISNLPPASLYYWENDEWKVVQTNDVSEDAQGYYYQFQTNNASQYKWRVEWANETKMEIKDILVSGVLYIDSKPSTARARAQLAMYPTNLVPETETFCRLAIVNVNEFEVQRNAAGDLLVEDIRNIATRDYEPVADWLTQYWDDQLTTNQEKVRTYAPGFMAPPTLLKLDYFELENYGVDVNNDAPPYPPEPPQPSQGNLISASVILEPPYDETYTAGVLIGSPPPPNPSVVNIEGTVIP